MKHQSTSSKLVGLIAVLGVFGILSITSSRALISDNPFAATTRLLFENAATNDDATIQIKENDRKLRGEAAATTTTTTTSLSTTIRLNNGTATSGMNATSLGAVVFLAPPRHGGVGWEKRTSRFCMLMRAVRSVDLHLNRHFGPYKIYILVSKDHHRADLHKQDAAYSERDRAVIQAWAPHSQVEFVEIDMYSNDALEPNTTRSQILAWRRYGKDGAIKGRDIGYQSMCRLWSGRLQNMSFLDKYDYYMRMDDDSVLTGDLSVDPLLEMKQRNLSYAWRRDDKDHWGIDHLWHVAKPYLIKENNDDESNLSDLPFMQTDEKGLVKYTGKQPYNNFHISQVSFWRSPRWTNFWNDLNRNRLFFKYRVGDANVHAIALMMMAMDAGNNNNNTKYEQWPTFPYAHNVNDDKDFGGVGNLQQFECNSEFQKYDREHKLVDVAEPKKLLE